MKPAPTYWIILLQNPQPIPQQELDAADKQRQPAHDCIAEGRAKGDHEKPDANLGHRSDRTFVLNGEDEVDEYGDNTQQDKYRVDAGKDGFPTGKDGMQGGFCLFKNECGNDARDAHSCPKSHNKCKRPSAQPR